jgi:hypothetical protein
VWGRADTIRPEPTAKGRWTVEKGQSVNEPTNVEAPAATTFTNHFHAPANVAQNSQHVQQTINIGWQDQARELVDEISGRLESVEDEHARAEFAAAVDELRAAGARLLRTETIAANRNYASECTALTQCRPCLATPFRDMPSWADWRSFLS